MVIPLQVRQEEDTQAKHHQQRISRALLEFPLLMASHRRRDHLNQANMQADLAVNLTGNSLPMVRPHRMDSSSHSIPELQDNKESPGSRLLMDKICLMLVFQALKGRRANSRPMDNSRLVIRVLLDSHNRMDSNNLARLFPTGNSLARIRVRIRDLKASKVSRASNILMALQGLPLYRWALSIRTTHYRLLLRHSLVISSSSHSLSEPLDSNLHMGNNKTNRILHHRQADLPQANKVDTPANSKHNNKLGLVVLSKGRLRGLLDSNSHLTDKASPRVDSHRQFPDSKVLMASR